MRIRTILTLLVITAVLTACGGKPAATAVPTALPQSTVPAAPPTVRPTTVVQTQPTAVPTTASTAPTGTPEDYDLSESSSLDKLDSYRATWGWKWSETKNGAPVTGQWDVLEELSKADAARHSRWSGINNGELSSFELIQVSQTTYIKNDDGTWTAMLTGEDNSVLGSSEMVSDPLSLIAGDRGRLVQRGMSVNGVTVDHYKLAETARGFMGLGVVDKVSGDVYVSPELQVVVKYVAHYEGKTLSLSGGTDGVLDATFDLTDINQPVKIVAPEGVKPPIAADIPIMEGATELTAMAGVVSYKTTHSVAEVSEFYKQAMVEKGWKLEEGVVEGMLSFVKDKRQATLMVQTESGATTVTVIAQE